MDDLTIYADINHVDILRPVSFIWHSDRHIIIFGRGKTRTFKPRRDVPEGTKQYQLRKYAEATLVRSRTSDGCFWRIDFLKGSGNLRMAVKLPEGEDLNEWLAVHGESSWSCPSFSPPMGSPSS